MKRNICHWSLPGVTDCCWVFVNREVCQQGLSIWICQSGIYGYGGSSTEVFVGGVFVKEGVCTVRRGDFLIKRQIY